MKIGILRETKSPPDRRVPLTPLQCREIIEKFENTEIFVQPDDNRAFTDDEYREQEIPLLEDLGECDYLLGIKEVKINELLEGKNYLFFSHTAKKQKHNKEFLRELIRRNITMIDYEYLTDVRGNRLVAFGRWAGIVGAYNALIAYGKRYDKYQLKPAWQCRDKDELFVELEKVQKDQLRIVMSGGGRVAQGAMEVLDDAGFLKTSPEKYLKMDFSKAVFCQLNPWHYVKRLNGAKFNLHHFFNFPEQYETIFHPYARKSDIFIACHFWDPKSPVFMTREDMMQKDFGLKVIADVSCDVDGPIPSTIRASEISDPLYGYDPLTGQEVERWSGITVMAVDNLPGELPRDASVEFGEALLRDIIPALYYTLPTDLIRRATITKGGKLMPQFRYLDDFIKSED